MPNYEFKCRDCEKEFSELIPYSEKKKVRCPSCGGTDLQEIFGLGSAGCGTDSFGAPPAGGSFG